MNDIGSYAATHESAAALHHVGAVKEKAMRHFDVLCKEPVVDLAHEIEKKRKVRQCIFTFKTFKVKISL
jgi:hypothetical protein